MSMRIGVLVYPGFDEVDSVAPFEVLTKATWGIADWDVAVVGAKPGEPLVAGHGMRITPDAPIDTDLDLLVVPGGGWSEYERSSGVRNERAKGELPARIRELHEGGTTVAGVCTGVMLLSAAGVLRGRPATTHREALEDLGGEGAEVVRERVVDDGDVLTCGGVTAGMDLALWLVERHWGGKLAHLIAKGMEYERQRGVFHGPRSRALERSEAAR